MRILSIFLLLALNCAAQVQRSRAELEQRANYLQLEMQRHPQSLMGEWLEREERQALLARDPKLSNLIEQPFTLNGNVEVIVADRLDDTPMHLLYMNANGQRIAIHWDGVLPEGVTSGAEIKAEGYQLGDTYALAKAPELVRFAGTECAMRGNLQALVIIMVPPGRSVDPSMASRLQQKMFSDGADSGSLNQWLKQNSFNRVSLSGEVRLLRLAQSYAPHQVDLMRRDMSEWAQANGINMASISRLYLVMPSSFLSSGATSGGLGSLGCHVENTNTGRATYGVTWAPGLDASGGFAGTLSDVSLGLLQHETGHNFSFHHHRQRTYPNSVIEPVTVTPTLTEYGGLFSPMSAAYGTGFYSAPHRYLQQWLNEDSTIKTVTASGEFTLVPVNAAGPGLRALRIPRESALLSTLWLEYRPDSKLDVPYAPAPPVGGTINLTQSMSIGAYENYVDLLDMTPGSPGIGGDTALDAQLLTGKSFFDPTSNTTIEVLETTPSGLRVRVSMEPRCGGSVVNSRAIHSFLPSGGAITLNGIRSGCRPAVSASAGWISLTESTLSGTGPIVYTLQANANGVTREGFIFIDGRSVRITQEAAPVSGVPLLSSWEHVNGAGIGYSALFRYRFAGTSIAQLRSFQINIRKPGAKDPICSVLYEFNPLRLRINADGLTSFMEPAATNLTQQLANRSCAARILSKNDPSQEMLVLFDFDRSLSGLLEFDYVMTAASGVKLGYPLGSFQVRPNYPTVLSNSSLRQITSSSAVLQIRIQDLNGPGDFMQASVWIEDTDRPDAPVARGCRFEFAPASTELFVTAPAAGTPSRSKIGSGPELRTAACRIGAGAAKVMLEDDALVLEVPVELSAAVPARRAVFVRTTNLAGMPSTPYPVATWTIGEVSAVGTMFATAALGNLSGNRSVASLKSTHPLGMAFLENLEGRFGLNPQQNCWFRYEPARQRISLLNDSGQAWLGPVAIASPAVLANSQCSVDIENVKLAGSLHGLEVHVPLVFSPAFAGSRSLTAQAQAVSPDATVSGWQGSETIEVSAASPPFSAALRPSRGSSHRLNLNVQMTLPASAGEDIVQLLIADAPSRANACAITVNLSRNSYTLASDDGSGESAAGGFGSVRRLNSQCTVVQLTGSRDFGRVTLDLLLLFEPTFSGAKKLYLRSGPANTPTPFAAIGTWVVVPDTMPHLRLEPRYSEEISPVYRLEATDLEGSSDVGALFLSAISQDTSCQAGWNATNPGALIVNGISYPMPSNIIARSRYCEISLSRASVEVSESRVRLILPMRFPGSTQPVTVYGSFIPAAKMLASQFSDAVHLGTWVPGPPPNPNSLPIPIRSRLLNRAGPEALFDVFFADADGVGDMESIEVIIGSSPEDANGCRMRYSASDNAVSLYDAANDRWSGISPLYIGGVLESQACQVDPKRFSIATGERDLSLRGALRLFGALDSVAKVFSRATDRSGSLSWVESGSIRLLSPEHPYPVGVFPEKGQGAETELQAEWSSLVELSTEALLRARWVRPEAPLGPQCQIEIQPGSGSVRILNDDGVSWSPFVLLAEAGLSNSQCRLKAASLAKIGERAKATLRLEFLPGFEGLKDVELASTNNPAGEVAPAWIVSGEWRIE